MSMIKNFGLMTLAAAWDVVDEQRGKWRPMTRDEMNSWCLPTTHFFRGDKLSRDGGDPDTLPVLTVEKRLVLIQDTSLAEMASNMPPGRIEVLQEVAIEVDSDREGEYLGYAYDALKASAAKCLQLQSELNAAEMIIRNYIKSGKPADGEVRFDAWVVQSPDGYTYVIPSAQMVDEAARAVELHKGGFKLMRCVAVPK